MLEAKGITINFYLCYDFGKVNHSNTIYVTSILSTDEQSLFKSQNHTAVYLINGRIMIPLDFQQCAPTFTPKVMGDQKSLPCVSFVRRVLGRPWIFDTCWGNLVRSTQHSNISDTVEKSTIRCIWYLYSIFFV